MRSCINKAIMLLAFFVAEGGFSVEATTELTGIRAFNDVGHTRIVLDLKERPSYWDVDYNTKNAVLKLLLPETKNMNKNPIQYSGKAGVLKGMSINSEPGGGLVIEMQAKQSVMHSLFLLSNPERMVVDLFTNYEQKTTTPLTEEVNFTRWEKSSPMGRLKIYVGQIKPQGKMAVLRKNSAVPMKQIAATTAYPLVLSGYEEKEPVFLGHNVPGTERMGMFSHGQSFSLKEKAPRITATIGKITVPVDKINGPRGADELVLYNSGQGNATGTNGYGKEVVLRGEKVVRLGKGNITIGKDEIVLSGHGNKAKLLSSVKVGDRIVLRMAQDEKEYVPNSPQMMGRLVIKNGEILIPGKNDEDRSTKSFLGITSQGDAVVAVVEGWTAGSIGMNKAEASELLLSIGVVDAIELLSHGNAELYVNGSRVNQLGDRKESQFVSAVAFS